jgi:hypothetical protein
MNKASSGKRYVSSEALNNAEVNLSILTIIGVPAAAQIGGS